MNSLEVTNWLLLILIIVFLVGFSEKFPWVFNPLRRAIDFVVNIPPLILFGPIPAIPAFVIGLENIELIESEILKGFVAVGLVFGIFVAALVLWAIVTSVFGLIKRRLFGS